MNLDFIEVYDNMLTHEECKEIIDYIENSKLTQASFGSVANGDFVVRPDIKDCVEIGQVMDVPSNTNKYIERALRKAVAEYWLKHPQIRRIMDWGPDMNYNLQKYNPKQAYHQPHCENAGTGNRMLVWMIYLNTVTDGGGTYFENYDRTTDAVEGRVVLWPPYWTHFHNGVVSDTQKKYIATGWFEAQ